jgi:hypothetical protein
MAETTTDRSSGPRVVPPPIALSSLVLPQVAMLPECLTRHLSAAGATPRLNACPRQPIYTAAGSRALPGWCLEAARCSVLWRTQRAYVLRGTAHGSSR